MNWAIEHGGWPVLSWFAGKPDEADRPRSDFVAQLPRQPINDGILPHQGRWFADGGVIRCWEHNLTRDAH